MTSITDSDDNDRVYRKYNANVYAPNIWCKQIKTDKIINSSDITTFTGEKLTLATSHTFTDDDIPWLAYDSTEKQWSGNLILYVENTSLQCAGTVLCVITKQINGTSISCNAWQNLSSFTTVSLTSTSINSFVFSTNTQACKVRWKLEGAIFE